MSLDKLGLLVRELLVIEAWRERVLPHLAAHLAERVDPVLTYLVLYHEASLANLLEVTLFHPHACEAVGEDALVELADWCHRKLLYLNSNSGAHEAAEFKERTAAQLMGQSKLEELHERRQEVEFGAAMCAVTILR